MYQRTLEKVIFRSQTAEETPDKTAICDETLGGGCDSRDGKAKAHSVF